MFITINISVSNNIILFRSQVVFYSLNIFISSYFWKRFLKIKLWWIKLLSKQYLKIRMNFNNVTLVFQIGIILFFYKPFILELLLSPSKSLCSLLICFPCFSLLSFRYSFEDFICFFLLRMLNYHKKWLN